MAFIALYTESCSPKVKEFKTWKQAKRFIDEFQLNVVLENSNDNWVDAIIKGEVVETFPAWYGEQVKQ
jgi:hypothetical protein